MDKTRFASRERAAALEMAMAMYTGEACVECGHVYTDNADLRARQVVFAGYHGENRCCCKACWPAHLARDCEVCRKFKHAPPDR